MVGGAGAKGATGGRAESSKGQSAVATGSRRREGRREGRAGGDEGGRREDEERGGQEETKADGGRDEERGGQEETKADGGRTKSEAGGGREKAAYRKGQKRGRRVAGLELRLGERVSPCRGGSPVGAEALWGRKPCGTGALWGREPCGAESAFSGRIHICGESCGRHPCRRRAL